MGHRRTSRLPKDSLYQLDLFRPDRTTAPPKPPGWTALPQETRHTLTGLMTRLLADHGRCGQAIVGQEAGDDV